MNRLEGSPDLSPALRAGPGPLRQTFLFTGRAIAKARQTPELLLEVLVMPVVFTVMFTYLFGGALAGSPAQYLQFLLPGILAQTVMLTAAYTGLSITTDLTKGVYDRFRTLPIVGLAPIAGVIVGDLIRHVASSLVVVGFGLLLGFRPEAGPLGVALAIGLLLGFAFGLSWIFAALSLIVRTPSSVLTLGSLLIFPATFMSNLLVDPATMPDWLQPIVAANPVTHLVTALRAAMAGTLSPDLAAKAFAAPLVAAIVFASLTAWLYRRQR